MVADKNKWAICFLSTILVASASSCDRTWDHIRRDQYPAVDCAKKALELYDINRDGKISGVELDQVPGLKASLTLMETDKAKGVTAKQIQARFQQWQDSKIGRMPICCTVTHNGQPLEEATIQFIPEKFLSEELTETATGVTDKTGKAMVSIPTESGPDNPPPGIHPGIYRVEITKNGEDIPAKYNTKTELGQEVSIDNPEIEKGLKFDLQY